MKLFSQFLLSLFLLVPPLSAENLPYTINNGWFPKNQVEYNETRLIVEGLPSKFLIKLKSGYHIEYASLFDKNRYIKFSFGERISKGKFLDDTTVDGYFIANGPEGSYETKVVVVKPILDNDGKLQFDEANNVIGDTISPNDNPIVEVVSVPKFESKQQIKEILSSQTTGLSNLSAVDCPIHVKTNDGHVFCISTYSLIDDDGIKRFKGYLLSISENYGLSNQVVKKLDFEVMNLKASNTPQLVFDESLQRLYILLDNQLLTSDDYGQTFTSVYDIPIDYNDIKIDKDCYIETISSGGNGIILQNGTICFPMNILHRYKEIGTDEKGYFHNTREVKYAQCFVLYSTDKGESWNQSPLTPKDIISWEFSITEYKKNNIMINARGGTEENWKRTSFGRRVFISETTGKGKKWKIKCWAIHPKLDKIMWDPICNASLITSDIDGKKTAFFSSPDIPGKYMPRTNLTVKVSVDYKNWAILEHVTGPYEMTQGYSNLDYHNGVLTIVYCDYLSKRIMFADLTSSVKSFVEHNKM